MQRLASLLRSPFSFLFARSSAEDRIAAYVIREHGRGRSLNEILEDRYVQNRLTPQQRLRLLDRPDSNGQITCDGVSLGALSQGDRLIVRPAAGNVTLLHPADHDYYRILRSKLRWGRGDRTTPYQTSE